jgi:hypothetical protein
MGGGDKLGEEAKETQGFGTGRTGWEGKDRKRKGGKRVREGSG